MKRHGWFDGTPITTSAFPTTHNSRTMVQNMHRTTNLIEVFMRGWARARHSSAWRLSHLTFMPAFISIKTGYLERLAFYCTTVFDFQVSTRNDTVVGIKKYIKFTQRPMIYLANRFSAFNKVQLENAKSGCILSSTFKIDDAKGRERQRRRRRKKRANGGFNIWLFSEQKGAVATDFHLIIIKFALFAFQRCLCASCRSIVPANHSASEFGERASERTNELRLNSLLKHKFHAFHHISCVLYLSVLFAKHRSQQSSDKNL